MIKGITSTISFGKTIVGEFNIKKTKKNGKTKTIPVQVCKLDPEDYEDCFNYEKIKKINMYNFFEDLEPDIFHTEYVIEDKKKGKLLGLASCKRLGQNDIDLSVIGTSKNKKYSGLGRAMIAGILNDIKGKYSNLIVSVALPSAYGFYEKCHFDEDPGSKFSLKLEEDCFDDVIREAKAK